MNNRRCIMGCEVGQNLHNFPTSGKRRAEWCRILGIYPRVKQVSICSAHFSKNYFLGNRLSRYSLPNPPESNRTQTVFPKEVDELKFSAEEEIIETDIIEEQVPQDSLPESNNTTFLPEDNNESESKVEDFEIRKGDTNDMIIKGRFVQTKDYLVVAYTPPRKWSLQEQVDILDKQCKRQLTQIRILNKEKYRLHLELKKYEKLLPKVRYLQAKASYFCSQLKRSKEKEVTLRKMLRRSKSNNIRKKEVNDIIA